MTETKSERYLTYAQNTACTIQCLSQILYDKIDGAFSYADVPHENYKEQVLALIDSIDALANEINLQGVGA